VPNTLGDITSGASGGASVKVNGIPTSMLQDKVKISSVRVGSGISSRNSQLESITHGRIQLILMVVAFITRQIVISQHQNRYNEPTVPVYVRLEA
jgi:hypothetical protein